MKTLIVTINTQPVPVPKPTEINSDISTDEFVFSINGNKLTITPKETIPNNTEVVITLSSNIRAADNTTLVNDEVIYYTTVYSPVYTTPTIIRLTEGLSPWINDVSDDTIWRTILKNTLRCNTLWRDGRYKINKKNPSWCAREFVLYSTVLDLMTHLLMNLINMAGSKKLADLSIDNRGPSSFQNMLSQWRKHIIDKVEELYYQVRIGCVRRVIHGVRGSNFWEPKPIIDFQVTWKRYPKVDRINPIWAKMYPNSQYNRNLHKIGEAYDVGKMVVDKKNDADFLTSTKKR